MRHEKAIQIIREIQLLREASRLNEVDIFN